MCVIELTALLLIQRLDVYRALHVFQQAHYQLDRYRDWVTDRLNLRQIIRRIAFYLPLLCFWFLRVEGARSAAVSCVLLLYAYLQYRQQKLRHYHVPLRFTARVWRLLACLLALLTIVTAFCRFRLSYELYIGTILLLWTLPWILLPVASCIVFPLERLIQRWYMKDAQARLAACPSLWRVGISGSYGKTSVKQIAYELLKDSYYTLKTPRSYNNRMGITRTIREQLEPLHEVFLCEMGTDHAGELSELMQFVKPQISIVTAVGPQHLQTFGSIEAILQEKMQMIEGLDETGVGILNLDNEYIRGYPLRRHCRILTFGRHPDVDIRIEAVHYDAQGTHFTLCLDQQCYSFHTALLGEHTVYNIAAAVAVGRLLHVSIGDMHKAISRLRPIAHRLQLIPKADGVWIDDAFNANPQGARAACEVLGQMPGWRIILTPGLIDLGEEEEAYNISLGETIAANADAAILIGKKRSEPIRRGLAKGGFAASRITVADTMEEAFACVWADEHSYKSVLIENDLPDTLNH